MKIKNTLLLILLAFVFNICTFSQDNLNLLHENKLWSTLEHMPWMPVYKKTYMNKFVGDTLIEGHLYKKIWEATDADTTNWVVVGFIREDENNKIFARNNWGSEGLIYDFTVDPDDTIQMHNPFGVPFTTTILEVDTVMVEPLGAFRKRIILASADPAGNDETWIEGIGSMAGILKSGLHAVSLTGSVEDLLCQWEGETLVFHTDKWNDCFYTTVGMDEPVGITTLFTIAPMPLKDHSIITIGNLPGKKNELKIMSTFGQTIMQRVVRSGDRITITKDEFQSGIYLVMLISDQRRIDIKKLIIQ